MACITKSLNEWHGKKHDARIVYDGTENYKTPIRWCSRCGSIYHPKRKKDGSLTKKCYWQAPRGV